MTTTPLSSVTADREHRDTVPSLEVTNVSLSYPDGKNADGTPRAITALDSVHLEAMPGIMTALTGPSGSGKSSLLAVASTLLVPTSGEIRIEGDVVTGLKSKERAELRRTVVGTVFQQPNLIPSLKAEEQLVVTAHIRGASRKERKRARERARDLLTMVGLDKAAGRRPHELSGGQRQRVNIARALMGQPRLLLVDEPTSALDQERSAEIMHLLRTITRKFDLASVVVTHDLEFVDIADREVTMVDGRLTE